MLFGDKVQRPSLPVYAPVRAPRTHEAHPPSRTEWPRLQTPENYSPAATVGSPGPPSPLGCGLDFLPLPASPVPYRPEAGGQTTNRGVGTTQPGQAAPSSRPTPPRHPGPRAGHATGESVLTRLTWRPQAPQVRGMSPARHRPAATGGASRRQAQRAPLPRPHPPCPARGPPPRFPPPELLPAPPPPHTSHSLSRDTRVSREIHPETKPAQKRVGS
ncbi:extensin-like [Nannospalax galili]|uniref:extensin-like n=1 Tax=Nannospalax galili TaxID=1026970 RepID=UPI0004ED03D8|nr:extensin-like [Nannospalax galili]